MAGRLSHSGATILFNNGVKCPILGFGTWLARESDAYDSVKKAIDVGYRHIDTAFVYQNEKEVGKALNEKITEGVITRNDIFVTSKLSVTNHRRELVVPALQKTLENLNMSYIDLFLIHAPWSTKPAKEGEVCLESKVGADGKTIFDDIDPVETWKGMEECVCLGFAKSIGVSNFNEEQTQSILYACSIKPVTNQVELTPFLNQEKLQKYSEQQGIVITAYRSLGGAKNIHRILGDERIKSLAEKYKKTPAQIVTRWVLQKGVIAIPKSVTPSRIEENFNIFDFEISSEDMDAISAMNSDTRFCKYLDVRNAGAKYFPFSNEPN